MGKDIMERVILQGAEFCAVVEDGRLAEYLPADSDRSAGDILLGKVDRIMPGLNCAFVEIGRKKSGFLPLEENSRSFQGEPLRSGDPVTVQIRREETGGKGAYLSRDLTLAGETVILMPLNRHIGVSARVTDEAERQWLTELGRQIAGDRFGLVLRARAAAVEETAIREETESLLSEWEALRERRKALRAPAVLSHRESAAEELLRDYGAETPVRTVAELSEDLKRQLREAEKRQIRLPHGGNIVIDRCEAMTVIDVNTAGDQRSREKETTVSGTNEEACREIALQVRLRNLSGIILIDLIDMEEEADRQKALETLREAFSPDRVKTVIHGYTALGLVEMTRKRSRADLYGQRMCPCPACGGSGWIRKE